jgi:ceramide glucosyltransferase
LNLAIAVIGWTLFTLAAVGALYSFVAGWCVSWLTGRPAPVTSDFPAITVMKPLHGDEPGLRACLEGFCTQDYPGPVQIVFGVRDPYDKAIAVVRALMRDHPALDIELVIDARIYGANLKLSNLINMDRAAKHPLVVLADSDVSVRPDYLRQLAGALADPQVGFATCAFIGTPTGNLWSRLSAMAIDHHFLPSVALGLRFGIAKPCFGPTVAFRREVFERAGGFKRFRDHLADDFEIGRAIRELGYGFVVPPMLIGHGCPERSAKRLIRHELRWARTIRLIDPLSYSGSVICHPLPWALGAVAVLHGSVASWAMLALVAASRLFVTGAAARWAGADGRLWWLFPVRDLLSAGVHVWGFMARTVEWRGRRFRIAAGGVLVPVEARLPVEALEPATSMLPEQSPAA